MSKQPYIELPVPNPNNCAVISHKELRATIKKRTYPNKKNERRPLFTPPSILSPITMVDRVTRASNANAHPGMVDRNPQRRSKEAVHAERQAKAAEKARAASERTANMNKVATLEKAERQKAIKTYLDANDPEGPALQSRVKRVRQHAEDDYEGVSDFMWKTTDLYLPF